MKYRYFSTRPVESGTYPEKRGCEVSKYPEEFYVTNANEHCWGHIDYDEPLTDEVVNAYELKPYVHEFSVNYTLTNEQICRLHNLLPYWRDYVDVDGKKFFEKLEIPCLFEIVMKIGCYHTINNKIKDEEIRQFGKENA